MKDNILQIVKENIDGEASFLDHISKEIWKHPELKYEEIFAHDLLSTALEAKGFTVQKKYVMPTAFRAEFDSGKPGPVVALMCEYDALPNIGHACGHNLIAEAGFGAGVAIKAAMEASLDIPGKVVVLGTPAEEGGGGKIALIQAGAFKDIDVAFMVHPSVDNLVYPALIEIQRITIQYFGKEAHAAGFPWEGLNALDAAVSCYNGLAYLRQHIKPTCRMSAIISKGGEYPNVIPGYAELQLYYRAATTYDMECLRKRIDACVKGAADTTGCEVKTAPQGQFAYRSLVTNKVLAERYKKHAENLGVQFADGDPKKFPLLASSDMGDVSHVVPSIHPIFSIGTKAVNHSVEFAEAAGSAEAQTTTLNAAKSMALLAVDVLSDKGFLDKVREQFKVDLAEDVGN